MTVVEKYTFAYADTPPSMNTNVGKGSWRNFHTAKKRWEGIFAMLLLTQKIPKGCSLVKATVNIKFRVKRAKRDVGNFQTIIEKALGDALQTVGVIPDDGPSYFEIEKVHLEPESGKPCTTITLEVWR